MRRSIFISYAQEPDAQNVMRVLRDELTKLGHAVFTDEDIDVGDDWEATIEEKLTKCDCLIVLLSHAAAESDMVRHEVKQAKELADERSRPLRIIPVRLESDVDLGYDLGAHLTSRQWLDWDRTAVKKIARALRKRTAVGGPHGARESVQRVVTGLSEWQPSFAKVAIVAYPVLLMLAMAPATGFAPEWIGDEAARNKDLMESLKGTWSLELVHHKQGPTNGPENPLRILDYVGNLTAKAGTGASDLDITGSLVNVSGELHTPGNGCYRTSKPDHSLPWSTTVCGIKGGKFFGVYRVGRGKNYNVGILRGKIRKNSDDQQWDFHDLRDHAHRALVDFGHIRFFGGGGEGDCATLSRAALDQNLAHIDFLVGAGLAAEARARFQKLSKYDTDELPDALRSRYDEVTQNIMRKTVAHDWDDPSIDWRGEWEERVLAEAKGQTVSFWHWAEDDSINRYISEYVGGKAKDLGIHLASTPIQSTESAVMQIEYASERGRESGIDLMWVNGLNFARLKEGEMLFGPFLDRLPNSRYLELEMDWAKRDAGVPIDGYEAPWMLSQFVFEYDSQMVADPPQNARELIEWCRENPGRFTYPELRHFLGRAFVTAIFYHYSLGADDDDSLASRIEQWQHPRWSMPDWSKETEAEFDRRSAPVWEVLREIEPCLWTCGYAADVKELDRLFSNGETWINMSYSVGHAGRMIDDPQTPFPSSVQSYVWAEGTVTNANYLAIPRDARNKAGALALIDLLLSPDAQYQKYKPDVWGSLHVLSLDQLDATRRAQFAAVRFGDHALDVSKPRRMLPRLAAPLEEHMKEAWARHVFDR